VPGKDLAGLARNVNDLADDLAGRTLRAMLDAAGKGGKEDVVAAARSDLGDLSMSGWRRTRPIQVVARYDLVGTSGVEFTPAKSARGPMTVLERGRKAGTSRSRRGRPGRRYGASPGKGTWSDAERLIESRTPARVAPEVTKAIRRQFGG
jgi:hypothetical protein